MRNIMHEDVVTIGHGIFVYLRLVLEITLLLSPYP